MVLVAVGPVQLALRIEPHTKSGLVQCRGLHPASLRHRLVQKQRVEHRHNLIGLGRHHQEFREWAVVAGDDEVVTVDR